MSLLKNFITMIVLAISFMYSIIIVNINSPQFFDIILISSIVGSVYIYYCFAIFIYLKENEKQKKEKIELEKKKKIEKKRTLKIKEAKAKKLREQKRKIELEQEEKQAYKKGRPSRTAKAAQILDLYDNNKRRMK